MKGEELDAWAAAATAAAAAYWWCNERRDGTLLVIEASVLGDKVTAEEEEVVEVVRTVPCGTTEAKLLASARVGADVADGDGAIAAAAETVWWRWLVLGWWEARWRCGDKVLLVEVLFCCCCTMCCWCCCCGACGWCCGCWEGCLFKILCCSAVVVEGVVEEGKVTVVTCCICCCCCKEATTLEAELAATCWIRV